MTEDRGGARYTPPIARPRERPRPEFADELVAESDREEEGEGSGLDGGPLTIAVDIDDPVLARRLAAALLGASDIRIAAPGEPADLQLRLWDAEEPADEERHHALADVFGEDPAGDGLDGLDNDGPPGAFDSKGGGGHFDKPQPSLLTRRETEVLNLMAEGASNKEIARRLGISVHTAKFHVGQVLDKLDATGRTDAVAQAARIGVLHL